MNFKTIFTLGILSSPLINLCNLSYAEDYVTRSQINAANGVAGLNSNKEVTANINSQTIYTPFMLLPNTGSIRFLTGDSNPDNTDINFYYNRYANIDPWGNHLKENTFYFTDHHGGNNYKFVGNVEATGLISASSILVNGKSVQNAVDKVNKALYATYLPKTPYNNGNNAPLVVVDDGYSGFDNVNIARNTLMLGGQSLDSKVGLKASCQNISGGDLGGSCYQFTDMSGPQGWHRSGAGLTDGVNVDIRTSNNSPIDVIGGNKLVKEGDGNHDYAVQGNDYTIVSDVTAGSTKFVIHGIFGCGVAITDVSGCKMTGTEFLNDKGETVSSVKVLPGPYDSEKNTISVELARGYKLKKSIKALSQVRITIYSADGRAYAIKPYKNGTEIYPALSQQEMNMISMRMALWTNIANGMSVIEDKKSINDAIDMPNYYYGYYSGSVGSPKGNISEDKKHTYTQLNVETYYYPGAGGKGLWKNLKMFSNIYEGSDGVPGSNKGDQLDYKISYTDPRTLKMKHNSNFHHYSQPALFLGLSNKNFNTYMLQTNDASKTDSITRTYDNQWDFWMYSDHDYSINSHGLTMSWGGSNHRLTAGSYMMWLAGFSKMPIGLRIDGEWEDGGIPIDTDGGFRVYKWVWPSKALNAINGEQVMIALGQAKTSSSSYQLFSFMSNDGPANNSLHLGMTKSNNGLQSNYSPTCNQNGKCSVLGQVIYDPLGYIGGIALGSGHGDKTKLGLIVDKNSNVIVNNELTVHGKSVNNIVDNAILKSQVNVNNGVAGLNGNKEITAHIRSPFIDVSYLQTPFMILPATGSIRFNTGDSNPDNTDINFYYNRYANIDPWGNHLEKNTFYFTDHHGGNNYKFVGNVITTGNITANNLHVMLSTPSSSSAPCKAGDIKDDSNYHYVCVESNKWKRVALSDF